jgi:hypothetical protein
VVLWRNPRQGIAPGRRWESSGLDDLDVDPGLAQQIEFDLVGTSVGDQHVDIEQWGDRCEATATDLGGVSHHNGALGSFDDGATNLRDQLVGSGQSVRRGDATRADQLTMSQFGVDPSGFQRIADVTVDVTTIDWDRYVMSKEEIVEVLGASYR